MLWDVTPANEALLRGEMDAYAAWLLQLANAVSSGGAAGACVLCRDTLRWKLVSDPDWLPAAQKGDAKPLTERQLAPLPEALGALVITPSVSPQYIRSCSGD